MGHIILGVCYYQYGIGVEEDIKKAFEYNIPDLVNHKVLNINNPIIHIRTSGDGRNVGRKIKHVIITCAILDDISNLYNADYHHTIILCSGTENYNLLKKILAPDTIYSTCSFRSIPTKYYTERIDIAKDKKGHLRHLKSAEDDNSTEQNNLGTCYGTHAKDEKGI